MASITFAVDEKFNKKLSNFLGVNLSVIAKEELIKEKKN